MRSVVGAALLTAVACSSSSSAPPPAPDAAVHVDAGGEARIDAGKREPTAPVVAVPDPAKDEDPSLLRAKDGTFFLAFYSNRDDNDRLYLSISNDGQSWSAPRPITGADTHAFYPSLLQAADGTFHLVWWEGSLADGGALVGTIKYAQSTDTMTWTSPAPLSGASALAWTPTITERAAGELVVVWSSDESGDKDIYVRSSTSGGASWGLTAHRVDSSYNDDIPFIVTRADRSLLMLWQRYDVAVKAFDAPFGHPSNDLVYATSADGVAWSAPTAVTNDPPNGALPDVIGALYPSNDPSGWSAAWASTRSGFSTGNIFSLGLSQAPVSDTNASALISEGPAGYSPRLVKTETPGLYLMAWVGSTTGSDGGANLDIYTRLVSP